MKMAKRVLLKRIVVIASICLLTVFVVIQFIGPEINNPPILGEFKGPDEVKHIFERSCYDCHSNKTKLKWFDKIAPISWIVAEDVSKARAGLNFTEWEKLTPAQQKVRLWEAYGHMKVGAMPLRSYQVLHPEAKITDDDLRILRSYLTSLATSRKVDDSAMIGLAKRQYKQWIDGNEPQKVLPRTVNGIAYVRDYKDWVVLSTSERFDNGTMRVIYGNAIAVKAVKENNLQPWPDGSIIIKVAWSELEGNNGIVTTGEFINFQYMVKDKKKYSTTEGWGFARFDGLDRKPFGEVGFDNSCINCHRAVSENDFVFTRPIKLHIP